MKTTRCFGSVMASALLALVFMFAPGAWAQPSHKTDRAAQSDLQIGRTQYFSFALPPGWQIGEQGQFALTLIAPDQRALTIMVGNSGLPLNHPPAQFAYRTLSGMQVQNLQMGPARQAKPAAGFSQAVEFDVSYQTMQGAARGIAKVSMAPGYDSTVMAMTAALAAADQWPGYASWLALVADQVAATDGGAFGRRGILQQNLRNSVAFGEAARQYRDWSHRTWQGVADNRGRSVDRRHGEFREALGGVQTYTNPFGATPPVELPTTHRYYWMDWQGRIQGTDDPGADPNVGSTSEWRRMEPVPR